MSRSVLGILKRHPGKIALFVIFVVCFAIFINRDSIFSGPVAAGPAAAGPAAAGPTEDGPTEDGPMVDGPMEDGLMEDGPVMLPFL
tara:strand:+ start:2812 stop:3069 length:258 start_codon:yes stop_codon:yes gene_type:complete